MIYFNLQKDPNDFRNPKRIRVHFSGTWEETQPNDFKASSCLFRYVGGQHTDKIANPHVKLQDIVNVVVKEAGVDPSTMWQMWSLTGNYKGAIFHDVDFSLWWATAVPDAEGMIHLYIDWVPNFHGNYHPNNSPCRSFRCPCTFPPTQEEDSSSNSEGTNSN